MVVCFHEARMHASTLLLMLHQCVQLVEFLLRKVIEEFEYHLLAQRKQVTKVSTVDLIRLALKV